MCCSLTLGRRREGELLSQSLCVYVSEERGSEGMQQQAVLFPSPHSCFSRHSCDCTEREREERRRARRFAFRCRLMLHITHCRPDLLTLTHIYRHFPHTTVPHAQRYRNTPSDSGIQGKYCHNRRCVLCVTCVCILLPAPAAPSFSPLTPSSQVTRG